MIWRRRKIESLADGFVSCLPTVLFGAQCDLPKASLAWMERGLRALTRSLVTSSSSGSYALSAQKEAKGWVLTLHEGQGFSRPSEKAAATVLKTDFHDGTLVFEHLNCDIQPGGDKKSTQLFLDVRFDKMLARVLIEIPE